MTCFQNVRMGKKMKKTLFENVITTTTTTTTTTTQNKIMKYNFLKAKHTNKKKCQKRQKNTAKTTGNNNRPKIKSWNTIVVCLFDNNK